MKIRTRLLAAIFIPVTMAVIMGVTLFFSYQAMSRATANGDVVRQIRSSITELNHLAYSFIAYREKRAGEQFRAECDSLTRLIRGLSLRDPEQQRLLEDIRNDGQTMKSAFADLSAKPNRLGPTDDNASFKELEEHSAGQLLTQAHRADSAASYLRKLIDDEIKTTYKRTVYLIVLALVLVAAFFTFLLTRMRRRITASLCKLQEGTEIIGSGNLDFVITEKNNDEFGDLSRAFNGMTADLKAVTASRADLEAEIVERARAENALRKSEERWATTLSSIGDAVIATDSLGKVTFINKVAEDLTGWSFGDAGGKPVTEVFNIINEQTRERVESPVVKVLREGLVVGLANHTLLLRKDGREVPIDDSGAPIRDTEDGITGVVLVFRDITGRKEAEEQAATDRHLQKLLLDNFPGVALLLKKSTREVVASNLAAIHVGAVPGSTCFETWGQNERPCPWCLAAELWETGLEQQVLLDTGERVMEAHWAPVSDDLYIHYALDVTEHKRAEEKLEEKERLIQQALTISGSFTFDWDISTDKVRRSESCKKIFGVDADVLCDATCERFSQSVHPEDRARFETVLRSLTPSANTYTMDFRLILSDGSEVSLGETAQAFFDSMGKATRAIGVAHDITERRKSEGKLRESEERFRIAQEASPDGFTVFRPVKDDRGRVIDFTWVYENDAIARMNGTDPTAVAGRSLLDLFPGHRGSPFFETYRQVAETHEPRVLEAPYEGDSVPTRTWFRTTVVSMGQDIAILAQDITERKKAEEESARHNAVVEGINEILTAALALETEEELGTSCLAVAERITQSKFGFIGEINPEGLEDIAISNPGWDACKIIDPQGHRRPSGNFKLHGIYGRVLSDGTGFYTNDPPHHPDSIGIPEGHPPLESFLGVPLLREGQVIGMIAVGNREGGFRKTEQDALQALAPAIVEAFLRKRAEQALKKSRDELEEQVRERTRTIRKQADLIDLAHDAIIVRDMEGRIAYWNTGAEITYGYTKDEALGTVTHRLLKTEFPGSLGDVVDTVSRKGSWEGELRHTGKDGRQIMVLSRWTLRRNEKGMSDEILEINRDITDRKTAEEQARQGQKMEAIGTLAGGIAHDFNNILASMIGFTEMAIEDVSDRPLVAKSLRNVFKSGMRARELVKQILTFSRKTSYERSPLSLTPIIKETVQLLRASISKTVNIRFTVHAASDVVLASPVEVQQILMNLATNASLAMEETGGTLEIGVADADLAPDLSDGGSNQYVTIMVRDTGCGMSPEVIKRIFEPFYTTRDVGKGSGMGLAVVYGIVKDLRGTITVESVEGAGSTFSVFLPKVETETKEAGPEPTESAGGAERILFVDDEEMLVGWGKTTLERLGYQVTAFTDSRKALRAFSADPKNYDLVITDHAMPEMAGARLSQELLRIRNDIPIILCTGHSETITPEKAKEMGIREYLMKPLARQELADAVRRILDCRDEA